MDVKVGSGAEMKEQKQAVARAMAMVQIGTLAVKSTVAVVTYMIEPLWFCTGNAFEVKEAFLTLQWHGPALLTERCLQLGTEMLLLAGAAAQAGEARAKLVESLFSGADLEML